MTGFRSEDAASALLPPTIARVGRTRQIIGAESRAVTGVTTLIDLIGKRVDWSHVNDLIAHGRLGGDGYVDLYLMDRDGGNVVSLTDGVAGVPQQHNDQPAWHPSGSHIVFQSKDPALIWPGNPADEEHATQAGAGFHNNLWTVSADGQTFTQLTTVTTGMAVLHPHFSHDGLWLTWAQYTPSPGTGWTIKVAEWVPGPPVSLLLLATYKPGSGDLTTFYETHGFTLADDYIIYSNNEGRASLYDLDIGKMHVPSGVTSKLTDSTGVWDEHAIVSPSGQSIVYASSAGYDYDLDDWQSTLRLDYWLMDITGYTKRRLTYFNELGYLESTGVRTIVADCSWSPDGRSIVALVALEGIGSRIVRIDLAETH